MKRFNVTGLCIPKKHYMVDISEKVDTIVADYINQGAYFTINRARQFGKTTTLNQIEERLKDSSLVISISFEAADDLFDSKRDFVNGFLMKTARMMRFHGVDEQIVAQWEKEVDDRLPFEKLDTRITWLCSTVKQDVVLIIDEVDRNSDNQIFLAFLGLLRNKYLLRDSGKDVTFQSVILAGVYNVKNLKLKLRPEEERKYNSPWNVAVDFRVDMSFSAQEIAKMLAEYSTDTGVVMDLQSVSEKIHFYTNGYPFLVSWICKWIDETGGREWTAEGVERAENELLKSDNTLFDDMVKNVENNKELKKVITAVLLEGGKVSFAKSNPAIDLGMMFGILKERNGTAAIANVVFETFLYNHLIVEKSLKECSFGFENNQFVENGQLDMERALLKFQEVMKAEYRHEDETFIERQGRLLFLCFMKPILNSKGNYYVEPETRDNTRMDVVISYGGQEYIVELKIWHGEQYRQKGLEQLEAYLESRSCHKGYLISFCFNEKKVYTQNMVALGNKKEVYEIVV